MLAGSIPALPLGGAIVAKAPVGRRRNDNVKTVGRQLSERCRAIRAMYAIQFVGAERIDLPRTACGGSHDRPVASM